MGDWQYGVMMSKSYGGGVVADDDDDDGEEFGEDEVWSLVRDSREAANSSSTSPNMIKNKSKIKIKIKNKSSRSKGGGGSSAHSTMHDHHQSSSSSSSAPVLIPDWSKIYGQGNASNWADHQDYHGFEDDDDGEEEEEVVPPHEWVARKLAGTQISSYSMCEGVGRTLKGRDLSKVRNAVLTKTGFLEQ